MAPTITTIALPLPLRMGSVNCYLASADADHVLFDTGGTNGRSRLLEALHRAGCHPGNLPLVVLTHGDFDHSANAAYLREQFGAQIAMHAADAGMVERGDMFWNRQQPNRLVKLLAPLAFRLGKSDRFSPDFYLSEGDSLGRFGLDADVIHLPGHSQGSIGIRLAHDHALIGGDLLTNRNEPGLNSLMDDPAAADASVAKLAQLEIGTVYPGHGRPFPLADFLARHHAAAPAP